MFRPPRVASGSGSGAAPSSSPRLPGLAQSALPNEEKAMSKKTTAPAPNASNGTRFDAYSVREYEANGGEKKSDWTRVGVAFPHSDGKGFNVLLQALPLDGKMVLRLHDKDGAE
jgi:hypothetical protein